MVAFTWPVRIRVYAAASLFDGKAGVRVWLNGVPILRIWWDAAAGDTMRIGRGRGASKGRGMALLRACLRRFDVRADVDVLVGTYRPSTWWIPVVLADMVRVEGLSLTTYVAAEQQCKGRAEIGVWCNLWDVLAALLGYVRLRSAT